ncbi:MAG: hypothetical protein HUJ70_04185, partial [Pseudobutyrivibrio sp.]|nr:hypothetical protein [Pseudobutyrivibrio sp.]
LNYQYGTMREDEVILQEQDYLFTNLKKHRMHFDLPAGKEGKYLVRIYAVNQKFGSIQDLWMQMSTDAELAAEDLEYLERVSIPRMTTQLISTKNGRIAFDLILEPNEICYVHMSAQYD